MLLICWELSTCNPSVCILRIDYITDLEQILTEPFSIFSGAAQGAQGRAFAEAAFSAKVGWREIKVEREKREKVDEKKNYYFMLFQ